MTFAKFLTTPIGSALRIALGLVLGAWVASLQAGNALVPEVDDILTWIGAALVIVVPLVIAALNPADPRFGVNKDTTGTASTR